MRNIAFTCGSRSLCLPVSLFPYRLSRLRVVCSWRPSNLSCFSSFRIKPDGEKTKGLLVWVVFWWVFFGSLVAIPNQDDFSSQIQAFSSDGDQVSGSANLSILALHTTVIWTGQSSAVPALSNPLKEHVLHWVLLEGPSGRGTVIYTPYYLWAPNLRVYFWCM